MSFAQQLIDWRRELHQYPELSLQEFETSRRVSHWLENAGLRLVPTTCLRAWSRRWAVATR
jgi:metal-dependent amidase/aminoacylase/carboxypeptidase family protein